MISNSQNIKQGSFARRSDLHIARKLWHISMGLGVLFIYSASSLSGQFWAYLIFAVGVIGFINDLTRIKLPVYNDFTHKIMGPLMRESEKNSISGLPFYALGCSLSLFLFEEKIAILSILFLIFSDPISSFVGILHGKHKILPNKSLEGSCAGFIVCYMLALTYGLYYGAYGFGLLGFSLLAGLIGSVSELFSVNIDDNLTIPLISGFGLTLLNQVFKIL